MPTVTLSPTPTIDVGPVALSPEDAGVYYLSLVCQGNVASQALNAAFAAGETEFFAGGEPDATAVKAAAVEKGRLTRLFIEMLDDPYYTWPDGVPAQVALLRSAAISELSPYDSMANATQFSDAYYATFPQVIPEQSSAPQEIRYQLKLDTDTTASCSGYETALDEIYAEMVDRNEYLAGFEG